MRRFLCLGALLLFCCWSAPSMGAVLQVEQGQFVGELSMGLVPCNEGGSGGTMSIIGMKSKGETPVAFGPIQTTVTEGMCVAGTFRAKGERYLLRNFRILVDGGIVADLPEISGGLDELRLIDPMLMDAIDAVYESYPGFDWKVCDHADRYMSVPEPCQALSNAKKAIDVEILSFMFPVNEYAGVWIPAFSGLTKIAVEDVNGGNSSWKLYAGLWNGASLPVANDAVARVTLSFLSSATFGGMSYAPGGSHSWLFVPQNVSLPKISFEDAPSSLGVAVRVPEDDPLWFLMYAYNGSSLLAYGAEGWGDAYAVAPVPLNVHGYHDYKLLKPAFLSPMFLAMSAGSYKLGLVDEDANYYVTDVDMNSQLRGSFPEGLDMKGYDIKSFFGVDDDFLVKQKFLTSWESWEVGEAQPDLNGYKPVVFEGFGKNVFAEKFGDVLRVVFVSVFLEGDSEDGGGGDNGTFVPVVHLKSSLEGDERVLQLSKTGSWVTPDGANVHYYLGSMDVDLSRAAQYDYTIKAKGIELVSSSFKITGKPVIAVDHEKSSVETRKASNYSTARIVDVKICTETEAKDGRAFVHVDRNSDLDFEETIPLARNGLCFEGKVSVTQASGGEASEVALLPVLYDAQEILVCEYPSCALFSVYSGSALEASVTGSVNVAVSDMDVPGLRDVRLKVNAELGGKTDEVDVYLAVCKVGMGCTYLEDGGLGASAQPAPFAHLSGSGNVRLSQEITGGIMNLLDLWSFAYTGWYAALLYAQSGDDIVFATSEVFEMR